MVNRHALRILPWAMTLHWMRESGSVNGPTQKNALIITIQSLEKAHGTRGREMAKVRCKRACIGRRRGCSRNWRSLSVCATADWSLPSCPRLWSVCTPSSSTRALVRIHVHTICTLTLLACVKSPSLVLAHTHSSAAGDLVRTYAYVLCAYSCIHVLSTVHHVRARTRIHTQQAHVIQYSIIV